MPENNITKFGQNGHPSHTWPLHALLNNGNRFRSAVAATPRAPLPFRLLVRGHHSRTFPPQRPSVLRAMWPAHCHFNRQILRAMSVTLVLLRIYSFPSLSRRETLSIALSIARWVILSLLRSPIVSDHVSVPYVITGNTHWSKNFDLRHWGILDEKISRNFPNAAH